MSSDLAIFLLVVGARFLVPLLIPRFPLPAVLACLIIDAADQTIFERFTDLNLDNYQSYDKALDIYYLTIAYLSVIRNWTNGFAVEVARFLWYYRLVGVVLFELFEARFLLFVFPNTFEFYFIAYEVVRTGWDPRRLLRSHVLWLAGVLWVGIKLPQEWWIHIAQNDFTDFVQETLFGVDPETPWGETFANRPLVAGALIVVLVALGLAALMGRRRLPPQDWPLRLDVDRPIPVIDRPDAPQSFPMLDRPRLEKITLITLVAVIFGQMLQLGATNTQIFAATALVVVLNSGLSVWLAQRGSSWSSISREFVVLAALNTIVLAVFSAIVAEGVVNRAAALFFGLLLTLIITMYDRYRGIRRTVLAERNGLLPDPS